MKASVPKRFSCPGAPITVRLLRLSALGVAVSQPPLEPTAPCDRAFSSDRSLSATRHSSLSALVLAASQPLSEPTAPGAPRLSVPAHASKSFAGSAWADSRAAHDHSTTRRAAVKGPDRQPRSPASAREPPTGPPRSGDRGGRRRPSGAGSTQPPPRPWPVCRRGPA